MFRYTTIVQNSGCIPDVLKYRGDNGISRNNMLVASNL